MKIKQSDPNNNLYITYSPAQTQMDTYTVVRIFQILDFKIQKNFNNAFKMYGNLFESVHELNALPDMEDDDLILFKNLRTLDCKQNKKYNKSTSNNR